MSDLPLPTPDFEETDEVVDVKSSRNFLTVAAIVDVSAGMTYFTNADRTSDHLGETIVVLNLEVLDEREGEPDVRELQLAFRPNMLDQLALVLLTVVPGMVRQLESTPADELLETTRRKAQAAHDE